MSDIVLNASDFVNRLWIIMALILMLAIVGVTWFIYRFSLRQAPTRQKQTPQTRLSSKDQQEALIQELLDLDTMYEAGKIKQAKYQERRASIKARLRSLMGNDVIGKPSPSKKTAGTSSKGAS